MSFKTQCDLRRNLMQLEAQADYATSNIGRCTTTANNAYWQTKADELYRLADQQYAALITEIERDTQNTTTQTRPKPVPPYVAAEPAFDDLGNVEAF